MNTVTDAANTQSLFIDCHRCYAPAIMDCLLDPHYHSLVKALNQRLGGHFRLHRHGGKYSFEVIWRNKKGFIGTRYLGSSQLLEGAVGLALRELERSHQDFTR